MSLRLRDAFERFVLPKLGRRAPATVSAYRTTLKHWARLTDDPPVNDDAITDDVLQSFVDAMRADGSGRANIEKQLRNLTSIFRACCRRSPANRRGLTKDWLLEFVPIAEASDVDDQVAALPRVASIDELSAIYEASTVAAWPTSGDVPAVARWRCLWVLAYHYGPRTNDLIGLDCSNFLDEIDDSRLAVRIDHAFGWLKFLPTKTRRKKPQPLYLPLTAVARAHVDRLRNGRSEGPLFGFPKTTRSLHGTRRAIQTAAGIDAPYTFQDLRVTCSTTWNDLFPELGEHVTGHAPRGVNQRHYDQALKRLVTFSRELPMPPAFLSILD